MSRRRAVSATARYLASAHVGPKPMSTTSGHPELGDVLHDVADDRLDALAFVERHLEHQLVVHGEDHAARELRRSSSAWSRSIIASLKMSAALPCTGAFCAMRSPIWRMRKLSDESSGQLAAPTEQRRRVAGRPSPRARSPSCTSRCWGTPRSRRRGSRGPDRSGCRAAARGRTPPCRTRGRS